MKLSPRGSLWAAALLLLLSLPAVSAPRKKAPTDGLPSVDEVAEKARAVYKDLQGNSDPLVRRAVAPAAAMRLLDWRDFDRRDRIVAWDALAERASEPNPFYESWYLLPSLRALAKDTRDLHILALEVDGRLEGVLPIQRSRNYYGYPIPHWRNWVHANCFLGLPLVARGHERAFWHGLLHHCDQAGGLGLFLHLAGLPAQGPMHQALADVLAEQARPAATVQRSERAMLGASRKVETDCGR